MLQQGRQPGVRDGFFFEEPSPLQGRQGMEGRQQGGHGAAVGQHRQEGEGEQGGGGTVAGIGHDPIYITSFTCETGSGG